VHAAALTALAARAEALTAADALADARDAWREALAMLPVTSQQHDVVRGRVARLERELAARAPAHAAPPRARRDAPNGAPDPGPGDVPGGRPPWRRVVTGALGVLLLLAGKLKLLVLGLTKVKTVFSMFAFFGLYWSTYGWPLALGLVGSIYAHEMGHVAALRRRGIAAGAPLFIPAWARWCCSRSGSTTRTWTPTSGWRARCGGSAPPWRPTRCTRPPACRCGARSRSSAASSTCSTSSPCGSSTAPAGCTRSRAPNAGPWSRRPRSRTPSAGSRSS
jgi:hypothetical protein